MNFFKPAKRILTPLLLLALVAGIGSGSGSAFADEGGKAPASADTLKLGERMYREGVLPSGEPMKAFVNGDVPVEGTSFTCVSCHLRSGLGSIEGGVVTPPTNGRILYQPRNPKTMGSEFVPYLNKYASLLPTRPAYTDESLADLIKGGIDPTGRSVTKAMPIYQLGKQDMDILIAYLKTLSDKLPPGVSDKEINFATVIVEGSDPKAVESMILPIQFNFDRKNTLAKAAKGNRRMAIMGYNMIGELYDVAFTLDRWILKGAPETWRAQLEEYYRKKPVFALMGGISPTTWEPVHRFCEDYKLPDLFPVVDQPVISEDGWYTYYFSKGTRQEGTSAARYLHSMYDLFAGSPVLEISGSASSELELKTGFDEAWAAASHPQVASVLLKAGEKLSGERLSALLAEKKPAALLLWGGKDMLDLLSAIEKSSDRPKVVLMSSTLLGDSFTSLPDRYRDFVYLTYPYRLPQDDARFDNSVRRVFAGKKTAGYDMRIVKMSYITAEIFGEAIKELRNEYYGEYLLETIAMMKDAYYPLFERVSFGPGQRYISKGSYIVQLTRGENPKLEKKSEWVAH